MREAGSAEHVDPYHHGKNLRVRPEEALARIGRWQHRQVTTAQLREAGWSDRVISARVRAGRLHPVFSGVFSLGGPPQTPKETFMAATLSFGQGTQLAASAAVDLYEWLRYPLGELFVLTPTPRRPRQGITPIHRANPGPSKHIDLIPVTGPEQTVLDAATTIRSDKAYRRVVRASQIDDTTYPRLLAFAAMNKGARGVARLKLELKDGPSRTRSANEDEVLELFRHGGEPIPNHVLDGDEFDLYFAGVDVAVEVMSGLHANPTAHADDLAKKARAEARGTRVLWIR